MTPRDGQRGVCRVEARLNDLPQFVTQIDGVEIHFIHVTSSHENALPLIVTHGWPGSVIELLDSVGPLTDPTAHGGSDAEPHVRPDSRQHHAVLADRQRRLGGPLVLGGLRARCPGGGRAAAPTPGDPPSVHEVPGRDLADTAQLVDASCPNLVYFNEVDKGGHFAAWEEPEVFGEELRAAFRSIR